MSDIEIAQKAKMKPIIDLAKEWTQVNRDGLPFL